MDQCCPQVLPSDYKEQGMPEYWTERQRKEVLANVNCGLTVKWTWTNSGCQLAHSKTLAKSDGVLKNILEMWGKIKSVSAVKEAGWTLDEFKWARFTVLTR